MEVTWEVAQAQEDWEHRLRVIPSESRNLLLSKLVKIPNHFRGNDKSELETIRMMFKKQE